MEKDASKRIVVADALRGVAVVGIVLVHAVESFDAGELHPRLTLACDATVHRIALLLLSDKMYGIFALLFGLTFHIMFGRGMTGRRFAWRMALLFVLGLLDSAFYDGDILTAYALCGLLLIPCHRLSNRWLWVVTVVVLLQPFELWQLVSGWTMPDDWIWRDYALLAHHHRVSGIWENMVQNLRYALPANMGFYAVTGRLTQIFGLFTLGLLFGRYGLFHNEGRNLSVWKCIVAVSLPLAVIGNCVELGRLSHWLSPIVNLAILLAETSALVVLWHTCDTARKVLGELCTFGRMSLSNYLLQSLLGAFFFYGWGLGLYRHLGYTLALLAGVVMVLLQLAATLLWARHHQRGPFEGLWRKATYLTKRP